MLVEELGPLGGRDRPFVQGVSARRTRASGHGAPAAIPPAQRGARRVTSLYDLMDCA